MTGQACRQDSRTGDPARPKPCEETVDKATRHQDSAPVWQRRPLGGPRGAPQGGAAAPTPRGDGRFVLTYMGFRMRDPKTIRPVSVAESQKAN